MKYVIQDWAGNEIKEKSKSGLWIELSFKTFQDGWNYIFSEFPNGEEDGTWDDLYVVKKEKRS